MWEGSRLFAFSGICVLPTAGALAPPSASSRIAAASQTLSQWKRPGCLSSCRSSSRFLFEVRGQRSFSLATVPRAEYQPHLPIRIVPSPKPSPPADEDGELESPAPKLSRRRSPSTARTTRTPASPPPGSRESPGPDEDSPVHVASRAGRLYEALELLRTARASGTASPRQYAKLISSLSRAGRLAEAEGVYALACEDGPPKDVVKAAMVSAYVRQRRLEAAAAAVEEILAGHAAGSGPRPMGPSLYGVVASAYRAFAAAKFGGKGAGHWVRRGEALVEEAILRGKADDYCVHPVCDAFVRAGRPRQALTLLRRWAAAGGPCAFLPLVLSVLASRRAPDWAAGRALWQLAPALRVPRAADLRAAYLRLALACLPQALDAHADELRAAGLPPDAAGLCRLLRDQAAAAGAPFPPDAYHAAVAHFAARGEAAGAHEWCNEARAAAAVSPALYRPLLDLALASQRPAEGARAVRGAMRADGVAPGPAEAVRLAECLAAGGRHGEAAVEVREQLAAGACDGRLLEALFRVHGRQAGPEGAAAARALLAEAVGGQHGGLSLLAGRPLLAAAEALQACGDGEGAAWLLGEVLPRVPGGSRPDGKVLAAVAAAGPTLAEGVRRVRAHCRAVGRPRLDRAAWSALAALVLRCPRAADQREAARALVALAPRHFRSPSAAAVRRLAAAGDA